MTSPPGPGADRPAGQHMFAAFTVQRTAWQTPYTSPEKFESFERINSIRETNGNFDSATRVNGWEPAVYMSCMSQNFSLFHVSNLSVRNFRIFLLMYTGYMARSQNEDRRWHDRPPRVGPGGHELSREFQNVT